MATIIVDASVAVKWFISEEGTVAANRLLGSRNLVAPDIIVPELANVLWKLCVRGFVPKEEAGPIIESFLSLPIEICDAKPLTISAVEIAIATGRTVYDSLHLALAIECNGVMITADKRLVNALSNTDFERFIRLLR